MSTAVYNQNYKRSVNKAAIPTCNIMGVDIAAVDKGYVYCHFPLDAAREVLFYINNNETYIKKLKRCYVGEEFFFQNIFMNTKWKNKVVNDCRIFDIWGKDRGYPAFLCKSDINDILDSEYEFARKFKPHSEVFEIIRKKQGF